MKHLIGISRSQQFSPNMVDNDTAIFQSVVDALRSEGCMVDCYSEQTFVEKFQEHPEQVEADAIFGMYRSEDCIRLLDEIDILAHIPSINSYRGIHNAMRKNITLLFQTHKIPMPKTHILNYQPATIRHFLSSVSYPCWLKRGDGCAQSKDDVVYVSTEEQLLLAMQQFARRGLSQDIVVSEHLEGDLVKFYGVEGTHFFNWEYASNCHSKFGLEQHNGREQGYVFSEESLKRIADRAAHIIDLPIYGGDCVVSAAGEIRIIDFNDWPSYSRCREQASGAIASRILQL